MKIGSFEPKTAPATAAAAADTKALPTGAAATPAPEASATVNLSASAALLAESTGEASFDQAKVERIATAIRDGNYKVDAGVIADKLIANAAELLGRKPV